MTRRAARTQRRRFGPPFFAEVPRWYAQLTRVWGRDEVATHVLRATPETVQWGAFDPSLTPPLRIASATSC